MLMGFALGEKGKTMIKRLEEILEENPLLAYIAKGVAYAVGVAMCFASVMTLILAAQESAVWIIGFVICLPLCGVSFGIAKYLDEMWW